jgi:4-hydroxy-3-polyprenylbenzoate decarboxylase
MASDKQKIRWVVGITGCSGIAYGRRLVRALVEEFEHIYVDLVISDAAFKVLEAEESILLSSSDFALNDFLGFDSPKVHLHSNKDIGASIASGSYETQGMVIVPCSMKTLAAVSHGYSDTLLLRAADVVLKEHRTLVLVPRESPLSQVHLRNMLSLAEMGARIVPAMPGFYHRPKSIRDLIDMMVMRILDQMQLKASLSERWPSELNKEYRL